MAEPAGYSWLTLSSTPWNAQVIPISFIPPEARAKAKCAAVLLQKALQLAC